MVLKIELAEGEEELVPQIVEQIKDLQNNRYSMFSDINKFDFKGCFVKSVEYSLVDNSCICELSFDSIDPELPETDRFNVTINKSSIDFQNNYNFWVPFND